MASRLGLRGAAGGFGDGTPACTRLGTSPSATFPPPCPWTPAFAGVTSREAIFMVIARAGDNRHTKV